MTEIWTGNVRRTLYEKVVEQFGPFDQWERKHSPGRGLDQKYDEFCERFAGWLGATSGEAVKHQISFAMPETASERTWEEGHARTAILNKAAALEAGFIENKHLPNLVAKGR